MLSAPTLVVTPSFLSSCKIRGLTVLGIFRQCIATRTVLISPVVVCFPPWYRVWRDACIAKCPVVVCVLKAAGVLQTGCSSGGGVVTRTARGFTWRGQQPSATDTTALAFCRSWEEELESLKSWASRYFSILKFNFLSWSLKLTAFLLVCGLQIYCLYVSLRCKVLKSSKEKNPDTINVILNINKKYGLNNCASNLCPLA